MLFEPIIAQAVAQNCVKIVTKKAPLILMSIGIGGMGASTVMAVKATPKASAIYKQITRDPELSPRERNKAILERIVPLYAPAAITAVGGATCIVGSYSINMARLAELGALYAVAQNNLTTYRKQVEDIYGKEEELKIHDQVVQKEQQRYLEDSQSERSIPAANEPNLKLFKDMRTKQFFWSTQSRIINTFTDICKRIQCEGHISYTEYAVDVGMEYGEATDDAGWLMGDDPVIDISEEEYSTPQGWKYREVHVDTNPCYVAYLQSNECL